MINNVCILYLYKACSNQRYFKATFSGDMAEGSVLSSSSSDISNFVTDYLANAL